MLKFSHFVYCLIFSSQFQNFLQPTSKFCKCHRNGLNFTENFCNEYVRAEFFCIYCRFLSHFQFTVPEFSSANFKVLQMSPKWSKLHRKLLQRICSRRIFLHLLSIFVSFSRQRTFYGIANGMYIGYQGTMQPKGALFDIRGYRTQSYPVPRVSRV